MSSFSLPLLVNGTNTMSSVERSFSNAAHKYDKHAHIQRKSAIDLHSSCFRELSESKHVLDIGCGTGILSSLCTNKRNTWLNLDISKTMLAQCQHKKTRSSQFEICADANDLPFVDECFDLVISNMALQWCEQPNQSLSEIYRVLEMDGVAFLSIILDESFASLKKAWQQTGYIPKLAQLPTRAEWLKTANTLFNVSAKSMQYTDDAKSTNDMLKRISRVGAGFYGQSEKRFSISESRELESAWQGLFGQTYKLEYQVLQLQLKKEK